MTRGTFVLIVNDAVLVSYEANGDMYFDAKTGYGDDAMNALAGVNTEEEFLPMLQHFNETHHKYDDLEDGDWIARRMLPSEGINADTDPIYRYTDYVFYKNVSNKEVTIHGTHGRILLLPPRCMCVTRFGDLESASIPEKYRKTAYNPKAD